MQTPLDPTRIGKAPCVHVRVAHEVRRDLRQIAARRGMKVSEAVRQALAQFIERERKATLSA